MGLLLRGKEYGMSQSDDLYDEFYASVLAPSGKKSIEQVGSLDELNGYIRDWARDPSNKPADDARRKQLESLKKRLRSQFRRVLQKRVGGRTKQPEVSGSAVVVEQQEEQELEDSQMPDSQTYPLEEEEAPPPEPPKAKAKPKPKPPAKRKAPISPPAQKKKRKVQEAPPPPPPPPPPSPVLESVPAAAAAVPFDGLVLLEQDEFSAALASARLLGMGEGVFCCSLFLFLAFVGYFLARKALA